MTTTNEGESLTESDVAQILPAVALGFVAGRRGFFEVTGGCGSSAEAAPDALGRNAVLHAATSGVSVAVG